MHSHRLLLAALTILALGSVVATGAFTSGDEAVGGVYLSPANTDNGQQYAEMGPNGQLRVEMKNMNANAESVADDVFTIGTDLDRVRVWIEDDQPAVTFYRMDTGGSIERSADAVELDRDGSVSVGIRVETGTAENVLQSVKVRAEVPERRQTRTDDDDDDDDDRWTRTTTDSPTETATDTPTETRTTTPGGGGATTPEGTVSVRTLGLRAEPEIVTVGESVRFTGDVENVGNATGTIEAEIVADGEVVASLRTRLDPGERATLTGTTTFDEPGSYTVELGEKTVTVRVEPAANQSSEIGGLSLPLLAVLVGFIALLALVFAYRYRRDRAEKPP